MPNYTLNSIKLSGTDVVFKPVGQFINDQQCEVFNITNENKNYSYVAKDGSIDLYGHAEGSETCAGWRSHSEGYMTLANNTSHAEGRCTIATGKGSHAEGADFSSPVTYENQDDQIRLGLIKDIDINDDYIIIERPVNTFDEEINISTLLKVGDIISVQIDEYHTEDEDIPEIITDTKIIKKIIPIPSEEVLGTIEIPSPFAEGDEEGFAYWDSNPGYFSYFIENLFPANIIESSKFFGINGKLYLINNFNSSVLEFSSYTDSQEYTLQEGDNLEFFVSFGYELDLNAPFKAANFGNSNTPYDDGILPKDRAYIKKITSTSATAYGAHAEGQGTLASGSSSHSEGKLTTAAGYASHAEGQKTTAAGICSHAEGNSTTQFTEELIVDRAEDNTAGKIIGHWNEVVNDAKYSIAYGTASHVEGQDNLATGNYSHAEGLRTQATGNYSHAEGSGSTTTSYYAHAEGYMTKAGSAKETQGQGAHAEGYKSEASNDGAHAEGFECLASGHSSHAEGRQCQATASRAHAEGYYTIAGSINQHVQGKFNVKDTKNKYAHIVGNGENDSERSNAHTLEWDGTAWYQGSVECSAIILKSPSGKRFKFTVDDDGMLGITGVELK